MEVGGLESQASILSLANCPGGLSGGWAKVSNRRRAKTGLSLWGGAAPPLAVSKHSSEVAPAAQLPLHPNAGCMHGLVPCRNEASCLIFMVTAVLEGGDHETCPSDLFTGVSLTPHCSTDDGSKSGPQLTEDAALPTACPTSRKRPTRESWMTG